jgi:hypothetical protein
MKTYGVGRYSSTILDLGSRWKWVVSYTPPRERAPYAQRIGGWVGHRFGREATEERDTLPLAGKPVALPTELPRLLRNKRDPLIYFTSMRQPSLLKDHFTTGKSLGTFGICLTANWYLIRSVVTRHGYCPHSSRLYLSYETQHFQAVRIVIADVGSTVWCGYTITSIFRLRTIRNWFPP